MKAVLKHMETDRYKMSTCSSWNVPNHCARSPTVAKSRQRRNWQMPHSAAENVQLPLPAEHAEPFTRDWSSQHSSCHTLPLSRVETNGLSRALLQVTECGLVPLQKSPTGPSPAFDLAHVKGGASASSHVPDRAVCQGAARYGGGRASTAKE